MLVSLNSTFDRIDDLIFYTTPLSGDRIGNVEDLKKLINRL